MGVEPNQEERPCPACKGTRRKPFLDERIDKTSLTQMAFASRKMPEFMNLRLVRCACCGLIYAPSIPASSALVAQYERAGFDSAEEAGWAAATYASELTNVLAIGEGGALEIGAGNGSFLGYLLRAGFSPVLGIEPSPAAIEAAAPDVRSLLIEGTLEDLTLRERFALICCFMTLEHLSDPEAFLIRAIQLLRPGGMVALVVHDWSAPINRLLGRRSPIIDLAHMQIFHPKSLQALLCRTGFERISIRAIRNCYPLRYWIRLLPLAPSMKRLALRAARSLRIDRSPVWLGVGNLLAVAHLSNDRSPPSS